MHNNPIHSVASLLLLGSKALPPSSLHLGNLPHFFPLHFFLFPPYFQFYPFLWGHSTFSSGSMQLWRQQWQQRHQPAPSLPFDISGIANTSHHCDDHSFSPANWGVTPAMSSFQLTSLLFPPCYPLLRSLHYKLPIHKSTELPYSQSLFGCLLAFLQSWLPSSFFPPLYYFTFPPFSFLYHV